MNRLREVPGFPRLERPELHAPAYVLDVAIEGLGVIGQGVRGDALKQARDLSSESLRFEFREAIQAAEAARSAFVACGADEWAKRADRVLEYLRIAQARFLRRAG